jgi:hypothetical protein
LLDADRDVQPSGIPLSGASLSRIYIPQDHHKVLGVDLLRI